MIAFYKRIRGTVQMGDLHRLLSPYEGEVTASEYVSADRSQAVVFALLRSQFYSRPAPPLRLEGLDEQATYALESREREAARHLQRRLAAQPGAAGRSARGLRRDA